MNKPVEMGLAFGWEMRSWRTLWRKQVRFTTFTFAMPETDEWITLSAQVRPADGDTVCIGSVSLSTSREAQET